MDRIILHAGTPKTGTTSLQVALHLARPALATRGILYPPTGPKPKHQWLVDDLISHSSAALTQHLGDMLDHAAGNYHTVLLSTEGLFNHWWDFSTAGRAVLSDLARRYLVEIWVWFRDPLAFCRSFYVQMLKNPPGPVACYGRDWSVDDMLDDPWFAQRLDYLAFLRDVAEVVRPAEIRKFAYQGTTVRDAFDALGCRDMEVAEPRENSSLGAVGVELLRCLNRSTLPAALRVEAVGLIAELDRRLGDASGVFALGENAVSRVACLAVGSAFF